MGLLTGATTPGPIEPGSNGNERVLYTPQSSRIRASPSDAVECNVQPPPLFMVLLHCRGYSQCNPYLLTRHAICFGSVEERKNSQDEEIILSTSVNNNNSLS